MKAIANSMTNRLIISLLLSTASIFLVAGLTLNNRIEAILVSSIDQNLYSQLKIITGLIHEEHGNVDLDQSDVISGDYSIPRSGHYYHVMMDKSVLAVSPSLLGYEYYFDNLPDTTATENTPQKYNSVNSFGPTAEPIRVLLYSFYTNGHSFRIVVAQSLASNYKEIEQFRNIILITTACSTILLGIIACWITGRSLRPLRELGQSIEAISYRNLDERLDSTNTVTELTQLANTFNSLLDRLETAFESQKRLVADASHELKTPVSVIRTQCDVILQRVRTPEEYVEALSTIKYSSRNLTKLINDLLSLATLDFGNVAYGDFQPVILANCIEQAVDLAANLAAERQVTVTTSVAPDLVVDGISTKLAEAILNLVENGIRYNRTGGRVNITATKEAHHIVIQVADSGVGMEQAELKNIFERFYRIDKQRTGEGNGLGLSIVKSVIGAHHGSVSVESTPGNGTTFKIQLPNKTGSH